MNFFDDAVSAHIAWKVRLRQLVEGDVPVPDGDKVADDHRCDLGQWIFGNGAEYAHLPSYAVLREAHARFHRSAAAVVDAVVRGDLDAADAMIQPDAEFAEASAETVVAIGALRAEIESDRIRSNNE